MNIKYNQTTQTFKLDTKNSSYIMKVLNGGYLAHLYYGRNIDSDDIGYVLFNICRIFSGNPVEGNGDRSFSLDTMPLEYPGFGIGDYRTSAVCVEHEDGSTATDFRFVSYRIYDGKPKLEGLPATYAESDEAMTLEILMEDYCSKVQVTLYYSVFDKYDVITRSSIIKNTSQNVIKLKKLMSACVDFDTLNFDMMHLYGRHACERNVERKRLFHGKQLVDSIRGASSPQHNPFVALMEPKTDEFKGECYGFSLVYSGNFICEIEVDQLDTTRLVMGINPADFTWKLEPDEIFTTPEVVMVYSENGLNGMSNNYHKLFRNNLCRGEWKNKRRPVLVNNWEATYFDFDDEKLISIAKDAAELGIEMLVMDDGWFGERNDDRTSLGDWFVNEGKIKGGLKNLVEKVNKLGLKFGIWFEPEMISENSLLYKKHPDWCLHVNGRNRTTSRSQLVLDMSRKDVQDYLYNCICNVISNANIEYVKWDMNRHITEAWSALLPADRQREVWHRYILGVYSLFERIILKFPHILFESCSGGGGRFDPGMLYYSPQIWTSDNTDAIERLKIQCGTSYAYPVSSMGSHVSAVPNHQTNRITSLTTRGLVALAGTFGYELDLNKLTHEEKEEIKLQVKLYKQHSEIINYGDYFRIESPFDGSNFSAWCFASEDKSELLFECIEISSVPNQPIKRIRIPCADAGKTYRETSTGKIYTGSVLQNVGINIIRGKKESNGYFYNFGDGAGFFYNFVSL